MNKGFFPKLAAGNIRRNGKAYIPYLISYIMTVALFYIMVSLSMNPGLADMVGDNTLKSMMSLGSVIIAVFAFIFLFYTNSFLVKRRKKEFGVFHVLGMEKRHLSKVMAWESLYVALIGLTGGLLVGIALDKVMFLVISNIIGAEISLGFFLSGTAVGITLLFFASVFFLIFLNCVRQIRTSNPIEMIRAGSAGEKEPKTKWLLAVLGLCSLGAGYYIALTVKSPLTSIFLFFLAVLLVIIGTYLLFTAGSIALLKLLRKNKRYYYKTRHFTSVSGMIYRMKQNAVGLANICVLSTAVLIMVSSTTSLMLGMEDTIRVRYPNDFVIYADEQSEARSEESFAQIRALQKEKHLHVTKETQYPYLSFGAFLNGDTFEPPQYASLGSIDRVQTLMFVSLEDYNRIMGTDKTLNEGEILLYSSRQPFQHPTLNVLGREYTVKETLEGFIGNGLLAAVAADSQCVVVRDQAEIDLLYGLQKKALGDSASERQYYYGFDTDAGEEEQRVFYREALDLYAQNKYQGTMESKADSRSAFIGLYGGFFFIGVFLGALFIMATVLIIYFKQISEGYDDKQRFEIMQKVGMSRQEVKSSIRSQVLTVFFLPLIVAGIHVTVALPLICRLLALMNLTNTGLYIACTGVCFLVFTVMYVLIYLLTARTYYRIVSR